jgi:hypothetical protein
MGILKSSRLLETFVIKFFKPDLKAAKIAAWALLTKLIIH